MLIRNSQCAIQFAIRNAQCAMNARSESITLDHNFSHFTNYYRCDKPSVFTNNCAFRIESVPKRKLPQYNPSVTSAFATVGDGSQPLATAPSRRGRFPTDRAGRRDPRALKSYYPDKLNRVLSPATRMPATCRWWRCRVLFLQGRPRVPLRCPVP